MLVSLKNKVVGFERNYRNVTFRENNFWVRNLTRKEEKLESYRLRYKVFTEELKWVGENQEKLEIDAYDVGAIPFGVFNLENQLIAYLRVISSEKKFMLEKEFPFLVGNHCVQKEKNTIEISRLCLNPLIRRKGGLKNFDVTDVAMLLYKGVYIWSKQNQKRYVYLVVDKSVQRLLIRKGFPCKQVGNQVKMPDGVTATAAILDWEEFERNTLEHNKSFYNWISQHQPSHSKRQLQQHASY